MIFGAELPIFSGSILKATVGDRVVVTTLDPKPRKWSDLGEISGFRHGEGPRCPRKGYQATSN